MKWREIESCNIRISLRSMEITIMHLTHLQIFLPIFQMLRAMYDFQAPYENTLTFVENDLFVVLKRNNKDHDWVHVINLKGDNGYVSFF